MVKVFPVSDQYAICLSCGELAQHTIVIGRAQALNHAINLCDKCLQKICEEAKE